MVDRLFNQLNEYKQKEELKKLAQETAKKMAAELDLLIEKLFKEIPLDAKTILAKDKIRSYVTTHLLIQREGALDEEMQACHEKFTALCAQIESACEMAVVQEGDQSKRLETIISSIDTALNHAYLRTLKEIFERENKLVHANGQLDKKMQIEYEQKTMPAAWAKLVGDFFIEKEG